MISRMSRLFRRHRRQLSCREVGEIIQAYLDDETDTEQAALVAKHLDDCLRCGLEADTYRRIKWSLHRRQPAVPADSRERLRAFGERLAAEGPPETVDR